MRDHALHLEFAELANQLRGIDHVVQLPALGGLVHAQQQRKLLVQHGMANLRGYQRGVLRGILQGHGCEKLGEKVWRQNIQGCFEARQFVSFFLDGFFLDARLLEQTDLNHVAQLTQLVWPFFQKGVVLRNGFGQRQ